jgi:hypothetical protein
MTDKLDIIIELSNEMSAVKMHDKINDIAKKHFNIDIHPDDHFWCELEEMIVDKINEQKFA